MIIAEAEVSVRYAETDAMGIAYHGNYLPWFEVARCALLAKLGLSYRELDDAGFFLPVLEANLRYIASARFDDKLRIVAKMAERPRVRMKIDYEVYHGEKLLTTGHTVHAFMNRAGHAIKPPAFVTEKFAEAFA